MRHGVVDEAEQQEFAPAGAERRVDAEAARDIDVEGKRRDADAQQHERGGRHMDNGYAREEERAAPDHAEQREQAPSAGAHACGRCRLFHPYPFVKRKRRMSGVTGHAPHQVLGRTYSRGRLAATRFLSL